MPEEQFQFLVGIDWATESHQICMIDRDRQVLEEKQIEHSGSGISQLIELLLKRSGDRPEQVAIALETPRGAVVETLVERQFAVYSLNPKQMDRFRDRHTVPGAKDDSRDAFVIADSLRTDQHLFHRVRLDEAEIFRLRELGRAEEDLQHETVRTGHRLRELLIRYYPQMLKLCPGVDEVWFWDLLALAPLPAAVKKLKRAKIEQLLKSHRIRRLDADQVLAQLKVPPLRLAPGSAEAASEHALMLLPLLRLLRRQKTDLAQRMQALLDEMAKPGPTNEHRDVTILLSLPGVGRIVTATMLAEASQPLAERDYHALRSYGGPASTAWRRSLGRAARNASSSCAEVATSACVTRSIMGRASTCSTMNGPRNTTRSCAPRVTPTPAPCAASPIGCWRCSSPCSGPRRCTIRLSPRPSRSPTTRPVPHKAR